MQVHELLSFLNRLYPPFEQCWNADENLHRDGDDFTAHGVCSAFSSFFQDHALPLNRPAVELLYGTIEQIVAGDPTDNDPVANALCTCFLENISHTQAGEASIPYMGPASRKFFDYWHSSYGAGP